MPSRVCSNWATAATLGVGRVSSRQRERTVATTSSACRRAEHPDRTRRGLLDALQQGVGAPLGHPVGVLDHDDLPAAQRRAHRRPADQVAHLVHPDRQHLGAHQRDVGMGPGQRRCGSPCTRRSRRERHCSAAAKARAALDRPDPGGPVNSQAWLIACDSPATARCRVATAASWPISSAQTPSIMATRPAYLAVRRQQRLGAALAR